MAEIRRPLFTVSPRCPHCGSDNHKHAGRSKSGLVRRFRCQLCEKTWKDPALLLHIERDDGQFIIATIDGDALVKIRLNTLCATSLAYNPTP